MPFSHIGEIAALGASCCFVVTALSFEEAGKRLGSLVVNFLRLFVGLALTTVFSGLVRGTFFPTDATLHAWIWLSLSGLVGFSLGDLCLFRAFVVLGARMSLLLMALVPPITALLGWIFLGERLGVLEWTGMALTVGGVAWVVTHRPSHARSHATSARTRGILLGLGGAAGQATGLILSKHGMGDYDPFAANQIRILAGTVGFAIIFSVARWWGNLRGSLRNGSGLGFTALGATFGPFLAVGLSLYAIQHTLAGVAATLMALTPVLVLAPTAVFHRQPITARELIGALVAVAGAALLFL